ncbi:MAG: hypothetical protein GX113_04370 [Actinobacteria bacterium]|jgi:hypothetical protein|nr:hypothetical protein [Actinomycetota bacterium]
MREKLKEPPGADLYRRRKVVVEPGFGQIKEARGFRRFSFRGAKAIRDDRPPARSSVIARQPPARSPS